jgi:hypothetical protein
VERYVIRGGKKGYERLLLLARDRWPDTAALFERAGLSPGMRCIDLGCGGIPDPQVALVQPVRTQGEEKTLAWSTLEASTEAIVS